MTPAGAVHEYVPAVVYETSSGADVLGVNIILLEPKLIERVSVPLELKDGVVMSYPFKIIVPAVKVTLDDVIALFKVHWPPNPLNVRGKVKFGA